ncbi:MAG: STAS domain-containing protein [Bacteroidetes bacterium]|nr:STAS domain-containing protein [Bacteroidota bacterium]
MGALVENFEKIFVDDVFVIVVHLISPTFLEANEFNEIIKQQISFGHTRLVVDLSMCEHIDSTFLGELIKSFKKMTYIGGALRIVEPAIPAMDIFTSTNTLRLFDLYKTREDAIKSFEEDIQPES